MKPPEFWLWKIICYFLVWWSLLTHPACREPGSFTGGCHTSVRRQWFFMLPLWYFTGFTVHAGFMTCLAAVSTSAARLGLEAFRPLCPPPTLNANWNSISNYKISLMASFLWLFFFTHSSISGSQTPLSDFHRNEHGAIIQPRRSRGFIERSMVWSGLHKTATVLLSPFGISGLSETWIMPQAIVVFLLSPFWLFNNWLYYREQQLR